MLNYLFLVFSSIREAIKPPDFSLVCSRVTRTSRSRVRREAVSMCALNFETPDEEQREYGAPQRPQRVLLVALISVFAAALPVVICAQEPVPQSAPDPVPDESRKAAFAKFLAGAAVGAGLHEAGHLAAGWQRYDVSRPRAVAATSAGFWAQHLTSETVLTRHPHLRSERSHFLKGVIAFHLVTSVGYTVLAMTQSGPPGRDTLDMSRSIGVNERWIGALVLAPALVDGIRYLRPEARWAKWLSRSIKFGSVALVLGLSREANPYSSTASTETTTSTP